MKAFESLSDVPDLVAAELLLPVDRHDLRVPKAEAVTASTTSPLEVSYVLFAEISWLVPYRRRLEFHLHAGERPEYFLTSNWMNHTGRAVVRAALDPEREAPIDMMQVYNNECQKTAQFPSVMEEDYYRNFIGTYGILERF